MASGHGGNPGNFESCRRFEIGFHNTFLAHPETKTVYTENHTPKYAFSSRARHVNACMYTCTGRVELSPGRVSSRDEIPHVNIPIVPFSSLCFEDTVELLGKVLSLLSASR